MTDNKGNSHAVSKLLTTKFPLCAILMELAATMQELRMPLHLHWVPREQNIEADELSNADHKRFDKALEIKVDLAELKFLVLDEMLDVGESLYQYVENAKKARTGQTTVPGKVSRKPDDKLKATHPW
jgi:hypothetical protein